MGAEIANAFRGAGAHVAVRATSGEVERAARISVSNNLVRADDGRALNGSGVAGAQAEDSGRGRGGRLSSIDRDKLQFAVQQQHRRHSQESAQSD